MLQRFRTLFNLPSTIRESISSGEYDLAVREYRKAKSIVLPSHVWRNVVTFLISKMHFPFPVLDITVNILSMLNFISVMLLEHLCLYRSYLRPVLSD